MESVGIKMLQEIKKMSKSTAACNTCLKTETKLLSCSRCKRTSYCSKECQKQDWKEHKKDCYIEETNFDRKSGKLPSVCDDYLMRKWVEYRFVLFQLLAEVCMEFRNPNSERVLTIELAYNASKSFDNCFTIVNWKKWHFKDSLALLGQKEDPKGSDIIYLTMICGDARNMHPIDVTRHVKPKVPFESELQYKFSVANVISLINDPANIAKIIPGIYNLNK